MKLKFLTITFLLLFARGCDFYSTSLWFFEPGGMAGEMNPLTRFLDVGFNGLLIVNALVIGLVIAAYYFYIFRYRPQKVSNITSFKSFMREHYYQGKGEAYQIFYKAPADKRMMIAHLGYILIHIIIFGSFLATFHNLCQYYNVGFYNTYREIVGRPLYVIYGLIFLSFVYFQYRVLRKEYLLSTGDTNG
jgi:hypothetical protein